MTTKHQVTDSKGQVHKRGSAERLYSHAIVTHWKTVQARGELPEWAAHSKAEWASRLDLAEKVAASNRKHHLVESVEILPAEIVR